MYQFAAARTPVRQAEAPPPKHLEDPSAALSKMSKQALAQYLNLKPLATTADIPALASHAISSLQSTGFNIRTDSPTEVLRVPWAARLRDELENVLPRNPSLTGNGIYSEVARNIIEDVFVKRDGMRTPKDSPANVAIGEKQEAGVKSEQTEKVEMALALTGLNAQYKLLRYGSIFPVQHFLQAVSWSRDHRPSLNLEHCGLPELYSTLCLLQASLVANDANPVTKHRLSSIAISWRNDLPGLISEADALLVLNRPSLPPRPQIPAGNIA